MEEIPQVEIPEIGLHDIFEKLVLKDLIVSESHAERIPDRR
jgi:hypothetical protein